MGVRVAVFLVPIAAAMAAMATSSRLLPAPYDTVGETAWWATVLLGAVVAMFVADRLMRRLLPLAALLDLSLAFPGRAPSRLGIARRAGSRRAVRRLITAGTTTGPGHEGDAARYALVLIGAMRTHDRRTRGHAERVSGYVDLIASEMRLPVTDADRIRWAALLHDVGKLRVPAQVLNKAGRLTAEEWKLIRTHPEHGAQLVAPLLGWLGEWGHSIGQHHERFDGTGYPHGLSGAQICLGARIIAVADAFDVMTSARSYRRAMSRGDALRELVKWTGRQFDPAVVHAFLRVSAPRLRWAVGPLGWLAGMPVVGTNPALVASGVVAQTALGTGTLAVAAVTSMSPIALADATAPPPTGVSTIMQAPPEASSPTALTTSTQATPARGVPATPKPATSARATAPASPQVAVPPGQAKQDSAWVPPGQVGKSADGAPRGQVGKPAHGVPPGQAKQDGAWVPPGQAGKSADGAPRGQAVRPTDSGQGNSAHGNAGQGN